MRNGRVERFGPTIIMPHTMKSTITKPVWLAFVTLVLMIIRNQWWPQNVKLSEHDDSTFTKLIASVMLSRNLTPRMLEKITPRRFLLEAVEKVAGKPAYDGGTS